MLNRFNKDNITGAPVAIPALTADELVGAIFPVAKTVGIPVPVAASVVIEVMAQSFSKFIVQQGVTAPGNDDVVEGRRQIYFKTATPKIIYFHSGDTNEGWNAFGLSADASGNPFANIPIGSWETQAATPPDSGKIRLARDSVIIHKTDSDGTDQSTALAEIDLNEALTIQAETFIVKAIDNQADYIDYEGYWEGGWGATPPDGATYSIGYVNHRMRMGPLVDASDIAIGELPDGRISESAVYNHAKDILVASTNVVITVDDTTNRITITSTGTGGTINTITMTAGQFISLIQGLNDSQKASVLTALGALSAVSEADVYAHLKTILAEGSNITIAYDDTEDSVTITSTGGTGTTVLTAAQFIALVRGLNATQKTSVLTALGALSAVSEADVYAHLKTILAEGSNITIAYDDTEDSVTITSTGGTGTATLTAAQFITLVQGLNATQKATVLTALGASAPFANNAISTWQTQAASPPGTGRIRLAEDSVSIHKTDASGNDRSTELAAIGVDGGINIQAETFVVTAIDNQTNYIEYDGYWEGGWKATPPDGATYTVGYVDHQTRMGPLVDASDIATGELPNERISEAAVFNHVRNILTSSGGITLTINATTRRIDIDDTV